LIDDLLEPGHPATLGAAADTARIGGAALRYDLLRTKRVPTADTGGVCPSPRARLPAIRCSLRVGLTTAALASLIEPSYPWRAGGCRRARAGGAHL